MYLPSNVPPEEQKKIAEALKRPQGTLCFVYQTEGIFNPDLGTGIILQVATGQIVYHLERDPDLNICFYHSTPGSGTRVAKVNIKPLEGCKSLYIGLSWKPDETSLSVGGIGGTTQEFLSSEGAPSSKSFRVDSLGVICQIGDNGVTVGEYSIVQGGKVILQPTAIEAWRNTIEAIKILQSGTSTQGYVFEEICTNVTIVMLVTGLEVYCRRRFLELEQEGITPNIDELLNSFSSNREKKSGIASSIKAEAQEKGVSSLQLIVDSGRIDFQNYDGCKRAYNEAYGIKFGDMKGITSNLLKEVQRIIGFRHRIVHVSPTIGMLNQQSVPPEEPVFPKREYAEKVISQLSDFVSSLHTATLSLNRSD